MRRVAVYLFAVVVGCALGVGSALAMAGLLPGASTMAFGDLNVEGWHSDFAIGSKAADPYTRARVARHGLLALAKSEAVYFTTSTDTNGRALREDCTYRINTGRALPAQWWSVTLYTADSLLPLNNDKALSINATSVEPEPSGRWEGLISPTPPANAENWISSRNAGNFNLTLRLYVPSESLLMAPGDTLAPPAVHPVNCRGKPG